MHANPYLIKMLTTELCIQVLDVNPSNTEDLLHHDWPTKHWDNPTRTKRCYNPQHKLTCADQMAISKFIKQYNKLPKKIVVAGSAPGAHFCGLIEQLALTNVDVEWYLFDPEPMHDNFKSWLKQQNDFTKKHIHVEQKNFEETDARDFSTHDDVPFHVPDDVL